MLILLFERCFSYWSGTMFIGPRRDLELNETTQNEFMKNEELDENPEELKFEKEQYQKNKDFGIKLYKNLENALEKRAQKSFWKRGRDSAFEVGIEDSDPHASTNIDQMIYLNQMKHFSCMEEPYNEGQKTTMVEGRTPFNVIKWLQNDNDMENDSEEELQMMMVEERRKKEIKVRREFDRELADQKEEEEKKKQRKRRFLRWARKKLKL